MLSWSAEADNFRKTAGLAKKHLELRAARAIKTSTSVHAHGKERCGPITYQPRFVRRFSLPENRRVPIGSSVVVLLFLSL